MKEGSDLRCPHCGGSKRVEAGDCPYGRWWWECSGCKRRWRPVDVSKVKNSLFVYLDGLKEIDR